ncbi:hypothetical protein AWC38_SpisGene24074 [Stylophora pistillata]|uniref:DUF5641 domain-containing protein n=1 Tax=Stylophora pistillata TaxID=50429 RepID=A0A2B4R5D3_STYPI|nr:hypothetical protein AWC38_SpisGene24074 [Stylophora pistillata]
MLRTVMREVEGILNGRPLSPVSNDPKDLEPLMPNHLLLLRASPNLSPGVFDTEELYSKKHWCQIQYMANLFWKRWLKEYLPTLQERAEWTKPRRCLVNGDLVLIADDNIHRGRRPLGRVIEVFTGKDAKKSDQPRFLGFKFALLIPHFSVICTSESLGLKGTHLNNDGVSVTIAACYVTGARKYDHITPALT